MIRVAFLVGVLAGCCIPLRADGGRKLGRILAKPINLAPIPSTPLGDVITSFARRFDIPIIIDSGAFEKCLQIKNVEREAVQLPKLTGVSLNTTLRLIAGQVGGAIVQQGDQLWLVPTEERIPRMMSQRVDGQYKNATVAKALEDLGERTGGYIVLDEGLGKEAERLVTIELKQERLDRAVERLAALAKLEAIKIDGALYVTTPEQARLLRLMVEQNAPR
jgi:hypothetical protein